MSMFKTHVAQTFKAVPLLHVIVVAVSLTSLLARYSTPFIYAVDELTSPPDTVAPSLSQKRSSSDFRTFRRWLYNFFPNTTNSQQAHLAGQSPLSVSYNAKAPTSIISSITSIITQPPATLCQKTLIFYTPTGGLVSPAHSGAVPYAASLLLRLDENQVVLKVKAYSLADIPY